VRVSFPGELAGPVGRDGLGQRSLVYRRRGVPDERSAGGRLDDAFDPGPARGVEHAERAQHVDVEVGLRIFHRTDHRARGGEVHDRPQADERHVKVRGVADVPLDEIGVHVGQMGRITSGEIVENANPVAAGDQTANQGSPHESGAAGDQNSIRNLHGKWSLPEGIRP
jgi:hypothetical protein